MAESKLTQDLAELAEQCLDLEELLEDEADEAFRLEAEAARRLILVETGGLVEFEATEDKS
jgi:hypothetical protein